jgi:hypothetical protein
MPDPRTTEAAAPAPAEAPAGAATTPPSSRPPAWRRVPALVLRVVESRFFKLGFVLLMVVLGIVTVVDQWTDFRTGIDRLGAMATFEALLCVLAGLWLNLEVWRTLMAAAGSKISARAACRIFFIGQLGKYMPGSVWPVLTQMELGRAYRIPRQRSATVAMLTMMIGLTSALFATVVGLPFMAGGQAKQYWWVFLFIPVMLVCLHPKVLNPVIERGLRIIRKPAPEAPLTGRTITRAMLINLAAWFFNGLQIWVLTARLGVHGGDALLASIGAYALAWCVGFLIIFVPAGAGVREAILVATLGPLIGGPTAPVYAIALISRGVTILGDLIGAGVAALLGRGAPTAGAAEGTEPAAGESAEAFAG